MWNTQTAGMEIRQLDVDKWHKHFFFRSLHARYCKCSKYVSYKDWQVRTVLEVRIKAVLLHPFFGNQEKNNVSNRYSFTLAAML